MGLTNQPPALPGVNEGPAFLTSIDGLVNWARSNSLWPLTFGCTLIGLLSGAVGYLLVMLFWRKAGPKTV